MIEQKPMNTDQFRQPHTLMLSERESLTVTGVSDVDSFNEQAVVLFTALGELNVRGSGLHVSRLCLESGEVTIDGNVEALIYQDSRQKKGSFFGKILS